MMKRVWLTAAMVILSLLLFSAIYLLGRKASAYDIPIHKNADLIIKVNVDGMIQTAVADFITNPSYYLKSKKKGKFNQAQTEKESGLNIPSMLFIYNIKNKAEHTFFLTLKLSDSARFRQFAARKMQIHSFNSKNGVMMGVSTDGRLTAVFDAEKAALAYSFTQENVQDVLTEILAGRNCINEEDERLKKIKSIKKHLAFVRNSDHGSLHFDDGEAILDAQMALPPGIKVPSTTQHREFSANSSVKMWLNVDFAPNYRIKLPLKNATLPVDSLLGYYKGYADLEIRQPVMQKDSVVSYVYDDNFEKVAQWNLVDKLVPSFYFNFRSDGHRLIQYLKKMKVLQPAGRVDKKIFPLYGLYTAIDDKYFQLSTSEAKTSKKALRPSAWFFGLEIDFLRLRQDKQWFLLDKYTNDMTLLEMKAKRINQNHIQLTGKIEFNEPKVNALSQLILLN